MNDSIKVLVDNANFYDATVFVVRNGPGRRLGDVTGNSKATFFVGRTEISAEGIALGFRLLDGNRRLITLPAISVPEGCDARLDIGVRIEFSALWAIQSR